MLQKSPHQGLYKQVRGCPSCEAGVVLLDGRQESPQPYIPEAVVPSVQQ